MTSPNSTFESPKRPERHSLRAICAAVAIACSVASIGIVVFQIVSGIVIEWVKPSIPAPPEDYEAMMFHYRDYFNNHNIMWAKTGADPMSRFYGFFLVVILHIFAWLFTISNPEGRTTVRRLLLVNTILFVISLAFLGTADWIVEIDP